MNAHSWKKDYWLWLPLMLVAWHLAWKYQDTFISDWDTFDYTAQMIQGVPTALGLGRALFLGYNRLLWLIAHHGFGLAPEKGYLILRYSVIVLTGPTILGIYALYKELSKRWLVALCGTLLFVNSPYFITYSGRGMSEIPGLLALFWGAWWMFRAARCGQWRQYLLGAGLFGLSANMREFSVFYFPLIPFAGLIHFQPILTSDIAVHARLETWLNDWGLTARHWRWVSGATFVGAVMTLAGPLFWAIYWPDYYLPALKGWYSLSAHERQLHPVNLAANWQHLITFGAECSLPALWLAPFALLWLLIRLYKDQGQRAFHWPLFGMGIFGLLGALSMLENHDLPVNPRYLLIALPGMALVSGYFVSGLFERQYLVTAGCLIYICYLGMRDQWPEMLEKRRWQDESNQVAQAYLRRMDGCANHAVFIVGSRTPLVNFYRNIGARPHWQTIAAGAGWPDEQLDEVIDQHLATGQTVYVDFDAALWNSGERKNNREAPGLAMIEQTYELRLLREKLFQIVRRKG